MIKSEQYLESESMLMEGFGEIKVCTTVAAKEYAKILFTEKVDELEKHWTKRMKQMLTDILKKSKYIGSELVVNEHEIIKVFKKEL